MSMSTIADFADILAAAGVIGSLLFLAFQVRSNTMTVRNQHFESHQDRLAATFTRPLDRQVAKVIEKGRHDYHALDGDEKLVFGAWAIDYLSNIYTILALGQQNVLRPEISEMVERRLKWFFRDPGTGQWFRDPERHPIPRALETRYGEALSDLWPSPV